MSRWPTARGEAKAWLAAFLADIPKTNECIEWPYGCDAGGYAKVNQNGKVVLVMRLVLSQEVGPAPQGVGRIVAAHQPIVCNNPPCINPRHLRWATPKENAADAAIDGSLCRGVNVAGAKLTPEDVRFIRSSDLRVGELAVRYDVTPSAISGVLSGKNWAWVS